MLGMLAMVLRTAVRSLGSTGGVSRPSCERVVRLGEEWEEVRHLEEE